MSKIISPVLVFKTKLGVKIKNSILSLIKINDEFYDKPVEIKFKIENGVAKVKNIESGYYLIKIKSEKLYYEMIKEILSNDQIEIKLPVALGLKKTHSKVSDEEIKKIYNFVRSDNYECYQCKQGYQEESERKECDKCKHYFCDTHLNSHNCRC